MSPRLTYTGTHELHVRMISKQAVPTPAHLQTAPPKAAHNPIARFDNGAKSEKKKQPMISHLVKKINGKAEGNATVKISNNQR